MMGCGSSYNDALRIILLGYRVFIQSDARNVEWMWRPETRAEAGWHAVCQRLA